MREGGGRARGREERGWIERGKRESQGEGGERME